MPETIDDIILIAKVSQVLSRFDITVQQALSSYKLHDRHPILLRMERLSLEYAKLSNSPYLYEVGEYVLALCGKYAFEARKIIALSNSGQIVSTYNTMAREIIFFRIEIRVGEGGSELKAGDTAYDIKLENVIEHSVDVKLPQGNAPEAETDQFSWIPQYSKTKVGLVFLNHDENNVNLGVQDGMLIIITGARYSTASASGSGNGGTGTPPLDTQTLPILTVFGNQIVNNQYQNSAYTGQDVLVYHNGVRYLTKGVDYSVNPLGGWFFMGSYLDTAWADTDEFIMIPNGTS
jgi:hypothetical protein